MDDFKSIQLTAAFPHCKPVTVTLRDYGDGLILPDLNVDSPFLYPDGFISPEAQYKIAATLWAQAAYVEQLKLNKRRAQNQANAKKERNRKGRCDIHDLRDFLREHFDYEVDLQDAQWPSGWRKKAAEHFHLAEATLAEIGTKLKTFVANEQRFSAS